MPDSMTPTPPATGTAAHPSPLAALRAEVVALRARLDLLAGLYARERQRADLAERRAIRAEASEGHAWRYAVNGREARR